MCYLRACLCVVLILAVARSHRTVLECGDGPSGITVKFVWDLDCASYTVRMRHIHGYIDISSFHFSSVPDWAGHIQYVYNHTEPCAMASDRDSNGPLYWEEQDCTITFLGDAFLVCVTADELARGVMWYQLVGEVASTIESECEFKLSHSHDDLLSYVKRVPFWIMSHPPQGHNNDYFRSI